MKLNQPPPKVTLDPLTAQPVLTPVPPSIDFVYETTYPIYIFAPFRTEEGTIESSRGQAFWSRPMQKAISTIASGTVTRAVKPAVSMAHSMLQAYQLALSLTLSKSPSSATPSMMRRSSSPLLQAPKNQPSV